MQYCVHVCVCVPVRVSILLQHKCNHNCRLNPTTDDLNALKILLLASVLVLVFMRIHANKYNYAKHIVTRN